MEDKGDKPTVPFRAREGRVNVAVFVLGLVLLFIGLIGALYGWFVASGLEATHAFTCTPSGPPEPYPGWCAALLSSASTYRTLAFGMVALFLVGIVLSVAGAVMKEVLGGADDDDGSPARPSARGAPHLPELWAVH